MKKLAVLTTLALSGLFINANSQDYKFKENKNKIEFGAGPSLLSNKEGEVWGCDIRGRFNRMISRKISAGIYGEVSPAISRINYPYNFGATISVLNKFEGSDTEFGIGISKNIEDKTLPSFSLGVYREVIDNLSIGTRFDFKTDLTFKINVFTAYSFSW